MSVRSFTTASAKHIFGDPLKHPAWKSSFEILIERRGIPNLEKIHYLKRYVGGSSKECIESFFLLHSDDVFEKAKEL